MTTTPIETPDQEEVLSTLENLIEITRDGQEGFAQAAEHASSSDLKALFTGYSSERARMVSELQVLERQHGKTEVDHTGSLTGGLHRAWINLRAAVATREDQAILEEAERGEDAAVKAYEEALSPNHSVLPVSVSFVLERHLSSVQAAHDEVRNRRDSGKYNTPAPSN
ncbi:MAG: PA2169 family four-helix-bundle protein [Verrucomicrobiaceae bacterium]|nr:MAG: PA2169 family four-helix-bundle protein [Verrucomicrobiaceae bacterium]